MLKPVCIIPARGGSKRLPGKNVLPFFGHPLIAYSIAAARQSGIFSRIIVSSDSDEIGARAVDYGAEFFRRPPALATDEADLVSVALHVLDTIKREGGLPSAFCQLMPNCPLRRADDIREHGRQFHDQSRLFQISVVPYRGVYPQWALVDNGGGRGSWLFGDQFIVRSQQLGTAYCPTGAIWWASVAAFREQRRFYGEPFHLAELDFLRGFDIDHPEELELADVMVRGMRDRDGVSPLEPVEPFISSEA